MPWPHKQRNLDKSPAFRFLLCLYLARIKQSCHLLVHQCRFLAEEKFFVVMLTLSPHSANHIRNQSAFSISVVPCLDRNAVDQRPNNMEKHTYLGPSIFVDMN